MAPRPTAFSPAFAAPDRPLLWNGEGVGAGTLLDHTMAAWATTNGGFNAHDSNMLPLILSGGSGLGVKHQGHLEKKGTPVASVWETMVNKVGMGLPEKFQGGQSKGVVAELV